MMQKPLLLGDEGRPSSRRHRRCTIDKFAWTVTLIGTLASVLTVANLMDSEGPGKREQIFLEGGSSATIFTPSSNRPSQGWPTVFVLADSKAVATDTFGFERLAAARGFMVVYPEAGERHGKDWGFSKDLPYFSQLTRTLSSDYGMRAGRAFACGYASGGAMALYIQDQFPELVARAAAVSSSLQHAELRDWAQNRSGSTLLIWNPKDLALADSNDTAAEVDRTVAFLLKNHTLAPVEQVRPTCCPTASVDVYRDRDVPELRTLTWDSDTGTHDWSRSQGSIPATLAIVDFFFPQPVASSTSRFLRRAEETLSVKGKRTLNGRGLSWAF